MSDNGGKDYAVTELKRNTGFLPSDAFKIASGMKSILYQDGIEDFERDVWRCGRCYVQEFGNVGSLNFCPHCGSPLNDRAVAELANRIWIGMTHETRESERSPGAAPY